MNEVIIFIFMGLHYLDFRNILDKDNFYSNRLIESGLRENGFKNGHQKGRGVDRGRCFSS